MSERALKQLVSNAVQRFNSGDLDAYFAYYDPAVRFYGVAPEPLDLDGTKTFYRQLVAGFPDAQVAMHDEIAEKDRIALRYTLYGTHRGEFMGVAATGNSIDLPIQTILRFSRDRRIVERWTAVDVMTLMNQLDAGG